MDSSFGRNFPLGAIVWWAVVGFFLTCLLGLSGLGFAIWFLINHVSLH